MKKALIFAMSLMLVAAMAVGCSMNDSVQPAATEVPAATEAVQESIDDTTTDETIDETTDETPADGIDNQTDLNDADQEVPADEDTQN